jgi:hypothetical protein
VNQERIIEYIADQFEGVDVVAGTIEIAIGDTFFIYDPNRDLDDRHRFPFATIVTKDYGEFDNLSNLDRPGVYRLNIGVSRDTFRRLFPSEAQHDYTALDTLMPHPVYAPQSWISVLNPSDATFETLKPYLQEAYDIAVKRIAR